MPGETPGRIQATRWLAQSERDLSDARFCAAGGRHALACFMAHQCAEKAVTSFLYASGAEDVWGHALADLCQDAMAFEPGFQTIQSSAILLDKHFFMARYPSALPGGIPADAYDGNESARAVEIASEVLAFCRQRIAEVHQA